MSDGVELPLVSIIIPTFNRANYIGECLDSLIGQTVKPLEIIVVDDGSKDSTRDVVARYGEPVRYTYKVNGGKPSAVNLVLSACKGEFVWLFDDDDVALPDAIEQRLKVLARAPDAGFVYSAHYLGIDGPDGRIVHGQLYMPPQPEADAFFVELMESCFFHLNSALVRRECYEAVGGLDSSLRTGEDYDMQIRLARIARPAFCPKPSFIFRQHQGVRGGTQMRYEAAQRRKVFRTYSAILGRKLRQQIPLGEFLVPKRDEVLESSLVRAALLTRIHVMANHGCMAEVFVDLRRLLEGAAMTRRLNTDELRQIAAAMRAGFAYESCVENWPEFVGLVRGLKGLPQRADAVRALAKGLLVLATSYSGSLVTRAAKGWRAACLVLESIR